MWTLWTSASADGATLEVGPGAAYEDLQVALADADVGDTVMVRPGTYRGTFSIDRSVTLASADGPDQTRLVAGPPLGWDAPVVNVSGGASVTLRGFTVDGAGGTTGIGVDHADLVGVDLVLLGASDQNLWAQGSTLTVTDSRFEAAAGEDTQHVALGDCTATFERIDASKGVGLYGGGAIGALDSTVTVSDSVFRDNRAPDGGAIELFLGARDTARLERTVFERNSAGVWAGGAVQISGGSVEIVDCTFTDNHSPWAFGALSLVGLKSLVLDGDRFVGNTGGWGGAVGIDDTDTSTVTRSVFVDNRSDGDGGAVRYNGDCGTATLAGNLWCGNTADYGGAIAFESDGALEATVLNDRFVANEARSGGAVAVWQSAVALEQVTVVGGGADDGAVWFDGSAGALANMVFADILGAPAGKGDSGPLDIAHALVWSTTRPFTNVAVPEGLIEADPSFVGYTAGDCTSDLRAAPGSPLVDGGDPQQTDGDGTRSDLGAFGGGQAALWLDLDADGAVATDCAPYDPSAGMGGDDAPADGRDPTCDGVEPCWVDRDGDGVGGDELTDGPIGCEVTGLAATPGDCDDRDPRDRACRPEGLPSAWFCAAGPSGGAGWTLGLVFAAARRRRR
ncbi:MAG: right-handed parallel beta-helix repeat-containing protein [Myxococcota bacterium]